jgi:hypothetical protein
MKDPRFDVFLSNLYKKNAQSLILHECCMFFHLGDDYWNGLYGPRENHCLFSHTPTECLGRLTSCEVSDEKGEY